MAPASAGSRGIGASVFLFGSLLDPVLRRIVSGRELAGRPAAIDGMTIRRAREGDHPVLLDAPGEAVEGLVVALDDECRARIDFYEAAFGYGARAVTVRTGDHDGRAVLYRPSGPAGATDATWSLADWQRDHAPLARAAAREAMMLIGQLEGDGLRAAMPTIRLRAAAALRAAAEPMPADLRRATPRGEVEILRRRIPFAGYFSVDETVLSHPRFDGGRSPRLTRSALLSGDAVTVLPYDPRRDRVLLVEQFRFGPFARGDTRPWCLEPIAGRIDPGETPEDAVHRETAEEAGLSLRRLLKIGSYYPSPGALSEYIYSYVGLADLPDEAAGLGGAEEEDEDIRAHVIGFDALMRLLETGEADSAPLWLSALWLARAREAGTLA